MISKRELIPKPQRRSRLDIIADILRVALNPTLKTRIMYACNLSFKQTHYYLPLLVESGLLQQNSATYQTTEKGKGFLTDYHSLSQNLVVEIIETVEVLEFVEVR